MEADLVLKGGMIWTVDKDRPLAAAVVERETLGQAAQFCEAS